MTAELGLIHVHVPPTDPAETRTLLLLHGTGGSERDFLEWGANLMPGARLLSPRGPVSEHGASRFFRRFAEGVFDLDDVRQRADDLAAFVAAAAAEYGFDPARVSALGYSNGANIAHSLMFRHPGVVREAALFRAQVVLEDPLPQAGARVLITSGQTDPIIPLPEATRLADLLRRAGAEVTHEVFAAAHNLTSADALRATEFFAGR